MFLLWSHGLSMCSLQISVLFVLMRVEIFLFNSGILGSCGVFLLVKFLCAILLCMGCGRSLSVLRILPTGMLVNVFFASCMSVGGCSAVKACSVSCVNLSQSVFLVVLVGGLSLVHGLSSRSFCCKVRMIWW